MGSGHIFQLNTSDGGVPKLARASDRVTELGLAHDRQAHPGVHGGPMRAVCLYGLERILALQAEGHPIYPGSIGDNVTVAGLDWSIMVPGVQVALGDEVRLEITQYTVPCNTIAASFTGGAYERASQVVHPGWARVYARVLREGAVRVGDKVRVG